MKRMDWKKRLLAGLVGSLLLTGICGCGSSKESSTMAVSNTAGAYDYAAAGSYDYAAADKAPESPREEFAEAEEGAGYGMDNGGGASGQNVNASADRKLIKTVDMTVESKEFDDMLAAVTAKTDLCGGYIESYYTYNGSRYSSYRSVRTANLVIRIPRERLEEFMDAVYMNGNVVTRTERVEDVTLTYVDLESRKKALLTEQERLLALMETAETMEDLLTIEQRLTDIRYQLQSEESQLRTYDNRVNYSTVNLEINEVEELTAVEEPTTWERISKGFTDQLLGVIDAAGELVIWFIIHIPNLIVWAVVLVVLYFIIKACRARRIKKREAKLAGQMGQIQGQDGKTEK